MLDLLSSKIKKIINNIGKTGKEFIFSRFEILGTRIIGKMLEQVGYKQHFEGDNLDKKLKRFIVIDGETKNKGKMTNIFNDPKNSKGEYIQLILGTTVVSTGVSFTSLRVIHIVEPQWRYIDIEQVIGRGIRTCSHQNLAHHFRNIKINLYISTFPRKIIFDNGMSTDQILFNMSRKTFELNETFLNAIKSASVNCSMNLYENNTKENPITCRTCINKDFSLPLFDPDIKKHILNGSHCNTENVIKNYIKSRFTYQGQILDKDSLDNLYMFNKKTKLMEKIGFIKDNEMYIDQFNDIWL